MKNILKRGLSTLCIISMMPTAVYAQADGQGKNISENTAVVGKIDDSGLTDDAFATLEVKMNEYIELAKKNKKAGFVEPEFSIPKRILNDDENEATAMESENYNEYEKNNTMKDADNLYLDSYINGIIEEKDIDYFKIKFTQTGRAYFRLTVPADKDYDLYLINSDGTVLESSTAGKGEDERISLLAAPEKYYYIRVEGYDIPDYSDTEEYKLKVKFYDDMKENGFMAGSDYSYRTRNLGSRYKSHRMIYAYSIASEAETRLRFTDCYDSYFTDEPNLDELNGTNEDGTDRLGSSVVVLSGYGNPTRIKYFYNTEEEDKPVISGVSTNISTGVHADVDFKYVKLEDKKIESRLMVFAGGRTAAEPETAGEKNLPEFVTERGAECAIGWTENVVFSELSDWTDIFYDYLCQGHTVYESALYADERYGDSGASSWKIYGNKDCIIADGEETQIFRSADMPMIIGEAETAERSYAGINVSKVNISQLNEYIVSHYKDVELDDYKITIKERDDGVIQIYYDRYINGFDSNSGFYAVAKDGKVIYFNEIVNERNDYFHLVNAIVPLSESDIATAKREAKEDIPSGCEITSQKILKEINYGIYQLVVETEYTVDYDTNDTVTGLYKYEYILL